jgi:hypothetical protein
VDTFPWTAMNSKEFRLQVGAPLGRASVELIKERIAAVKSILDYFLMKSKIELTLL